MRKILYAECEPECSLKGGLRNPFPWERGGRHPWDAKHREVFFNDLDLSREWLKLFPEPPDFERKHVVEVGCGCGALSVLSALRGARSVLGVEADVLRADMARYTVSEEYPELNGRIRFVDYRVIGAPRCNERFDVVLSQNSFEHYEEPENVLQRMVEILKPGGTIYAGFGPLWNSPFGSHLKEFCRLPWAHLWGGDYLFKVHNRVRPHDPRTTWRSLGLNQSPYHRFREMFAKLDNCEVISFLGNQSIRRKHRLAYTLIEPFRSIPFLKEYLTVSLFVVVRKHGRRKMRESHGIHDV